MATGTNRISHCGCGSPLFTGNRRLERTNFRSRALYSSFLSNLLGMDWRFGALHFMRHLIDGDCPIDHYQWAMQAGVTHCVDKTWTRIYNPEQSAVDRCDPEGTFIKRWVPELAHLPPECLGCPPSIKGYPAPILNYKKRDVSVSSS